MTLQTRIATFVMAKARRNRAVALLAGAGFAAIAAQPAAAQDIPGPNDVVITGLEASLPQDLARYGNDIATVSETEIRNAAAVDVAEALEAVPGLYIKAGNGPFSYVDVSLQGSRTKDVLWTVDGVRINNRLYGGTSPNDTLPASMVERIEVLKGGESLFYYGHPGGGRGDQYRHPILQRPVRRPDQRQHRQPRRKQSRRLSAWEPWRPSFRLVGITQSGRRLSAVQRDGAERLRSAARL
jgi:hypothetical protein